MILHTCRAAWLAAVTAVALVTLTPAWAAGPACLKLPPGKVAFQLYAVYEAASGPMPRPAPGQPFRMPKAPPEALEKLFTDMHSIGWRRMENFAATSGLPAEQYVALVKKSGLQAISSHENLDIAGWEAVLDEANRLGQTYVGSGGAGEPGIDTLEHTLQSAAKLELLGEAAAKHGLKFFIHTHQLEIKNRFAIDLKGDGHPQMMSALDILAAKTDPRYVNFEIDIGWAAAAFGLDQSATAQFLTQHRKRIVLVHVKDMSADSKPTDMGSGVLDYAKLLKAAGPQVAYYIWEYDHPPMPLQSAARAYRYMTCTKSTG